jgi:hypothetical protein
VDTTPSGMSPADKKKMEQNLRKAAAAED